MLSPEKSEKGLKYSKRGFWCDFNIVMERSRRNYNTSARIREKRMSRMLNSKEKEKKGVEFSKGGERRWMFNQKEEGSAKE